MGERIVLIILILCLFSCDSKPKKDVKPSVARPNIILIMSDDMGYSDIAPFGGEIETPSLSRLARNGLRMTQFYNAGRCCPTRASLMTGCYPHQTGIGHMTNPPNNSVGHDYGTPAYRGYLNRNTVTIAEVLGQSGYRTFMTGKWHLGYHDRDQWPLQRGFDRFYGIVPGAANFFRPVHPRGIVSGNEAIKIGDNEEYYTTDAFTDEAIRFIKTSQQEDPETPFFLYLAYNAPHWPIQAPEEVIAKYRGRYSEGWQRLREARYDRMKKMGIIDSSWQLSPRDARDWESLDTEKQEEMDLRMAIYAAMVDRMDQNIGKLLDSLQSNQLMENTIIMFLNDNGACAEFSELGSGPKEQLGTEEGYVLTYGRAWANASNTPFREYKHWLHEGGIATPFIVHWPKGIPRAQQGKMITEYGFLPDIMATCIDLAGATYPQEHLGKPIVPLSGKSLLPLFHGTEQRLHTEPIFWEHEGNKAVRFGDLKLVQKWNPDGPQTWELYDMGKDRTEMDNIIGQERKRASEMIGWYETWAQENGILPWEEIVAIRSKTNH